MSEKLELTVTAGPSKGGRFEVTAAGLRMGRSSTCEISVADPALSRSHCLFELRDGEVWITDLASANGTEVNGTLLGAESVRLAPGDRIVAGETELVFGVVPSAPSAVDLGLGTPKEEDAGDARKPAKLLSVGNLLRAAAVVCVAAAAAAILLSSDETPVVEIRGTPAAEEKPRLRRFGFEKVEAGPSSIYRYALRYDGKSIAVEIDDTADSRHVRKEAVLGGEASATLEEIFADQELYRLDPEYAGVPAKAGTLKSYVLEGVRGGKKFSVVVENVDEPEPFRVVRERLETFSKNELGIWAIQYSADRLTEMAADARRTGDAKWDEREVGHGNVAAAVDAYHKAEFYLETVNPKPEWHGELVARRREAERELDARFRDQCFLADRAINLADWDTAVHELRVLCELVPDKKDPRHAEAVKKLLDVENRIKKGGRR